ncbi:MAG TPA: IS66 family transposase, partial [Chitinophagaceae bacterium]|nr:IS66 family transposase [Chitinophagaceae bacterium]
LEQVKFELRLEKRYRYGIKSEKHHRPTEDENGNPINDPQLTLPFEIDAWGTCRLNKRQKLSFIRGGKTTTPKKPGGRKAIPDLPEEIIDLHPDNIPPNSKCVGHKDQVLITCDPPRWRKKIIRRWVYLTVAEDEVTHKQLIAPLPPHPIPRCKMDVSVLVMMIIDKYLYHLPLWRQRRRFIQYGMELSYSTMVHDVGKIADILEPLAHLLLYEIVSSRLMHLDETGYVVLDNTKKKGKKSHRGWMWAAMNPVQRICCFMYQKGRGKKDIKHVLKGYTGNLLTDGHGAYTKFGQQPNVKHGKCGGHIRRYFEQALENDHERASYVLENFFGPIYGIEEECKLCGLTYDEITEKRQADAVPILNALRDWLFAELPKLTPRTPIYKAFNYALNHFDGMMVYTTDGMLAFDNNDLEREIRAIAMGRNSHLFAGSHRGGQRDAVMYSLIATCKLQGIDPSVWMSDVLRRINTQPDHKLYELLPQFWKPLEQQQSACAS